ncbi:MAG: hypothetical protein RR436_06905 [Clostridia bacterium]
MSTQAKNHRLAAVKLADAVNKTEGVTVSDKARTLSACWARGEVSGEEMKANLIMTHKQPLSGTQR